MYTCPQTPPSGNHMMVAQLWVKPVTSWSQVQCPSLTVWYSTSNVSKVHEMCDRLSSSCSQVVLIYLYPIYATATNCKKKTLRARCTNIVQLWTRVKSEFDPSLVVNCVASKQFKCWSPFNSELPSDHRSNFDLGSTHGYAYAVGNKYFPSYYWVKM